MYEKADHPHLERAEQTRVHEKAGQKAGPRRFQGWVAQHLLCPLRRRPKRAKFETLRSEAALPKNFYRRTTGSHHEEARKCRASYGEAARGHRLSELRLL